MSKFVKFPCDYIGKSVCCAVDIHTISAVQVEDDGFLSVFFQNGHKWRVKITSQNNEDVKNFLKEVGIKWEKNL